MRSVGEQSTKQLAHPVLCRLLEARAAQHHRIQAALGEPLAAGPW